MIPKLFGFLFGMWVLILIGGGIVVTVLGPLSISGFDAITGSAIKATVAVILVVIWVMILSKMKSWIFRKEIGF